MTDWAPLWLSVQVALLATGFALVTGVGLAAVAALSKSRLGDLLDAVVMAPMVLPPTVLGYYVLVALGRDSALGKAYEALTGSPVVFTKTGAVVAAWLGALPLVLKSARAAMEDVDPLLVAAARTLGAGPLRAWLRVILPLARGGIVAGGALGFARALGDFGVTLMVAGNIPGVTRTASLAIYDAVQANREGEALGMIWVLSVSAIAVLYGVNRLQRRGRVGALPFRPFAGPDAAASPSSGGAPPARSHPPVEAGGALAHAGEAGGSGATANDDSEGRSLRIDVRLSPGRRGPEGLRAEFLLTPGVHLLFGASGAGKTSLLCTIAGLLRPDAGRIVVGDQVLFEDHRAVDLGPERRGVGLLFQGLALFPHLSARENVAFGARGDRRAREAAAQHWLARMGVGHLAERKPNTLSGGEAQRVALARALASEPRALLLDEPFSALHEELRRKLAAEVTEIVREHQIVCLLVTHDRSEAARHPGRIWELADGQVTQLTRRGVSTGADSSASS